jgi:hypothetical protein
MSLAQATQTRVDHPSTTLKGDKRAVLRSAPMRATRLAGRPRRRVTMGRGSGGPALDPQLAWFGEQLERGTAQAVADLNAAGSVLGQHV